MSSTAVSKILSVASVVGVFATAYTAIRGYKKSKDILDEMGLTLEDAFESKEKFIEVGKATWTGWLPCGLSIIFTTGSIIGVNFGYLKTTGALAGALAAATTQIKKMDRGMIEKYGKKEWTKIKSELAAKDAAKHPEIIKKANELKNDGTNWEIYYDSVTRQVFKGSEIDVLRAEIELNRAFSRFYEVSVADYISFFNKDGLTVCPSDDDWGWYMDNTFDWNASFNEDGSYIHLNMEKQHVDGFDDEMIVITPTLFPADPSEDWSEYSATHGTYKYLPETSWKSHNLHAV